MGKGLKFYYFNFYIIIGGEIIIIGIYKITNLINNKSIVAVGECGLDFYYGKDNKEKQEVLKQRELNEDGSSEIKPAL